MKGQYKYSRNRKLTVEVDIVGFVLATMFYNLDGAAQKCGCRHGSMGRGRSIVPANPRGVAIYAIVCL